MWVKLKHTLIARVVPFYQEKIASARAQPEYPVLPGREMHRLRV